LLSKEKAAVLKRYTESVEAYELYLKGRYYWWKTDPQEFLNGKEYFERALEVDPNYALSYCGLSSYYGFGAAFGMIPPDGVLFELISYFYKSKQSLRRSQLPPSF
jgi:hypothetical protein